MSMTARADEATPLLLDTEAGHGGPRPPSAAAHNDGSHSSSTRSTFSRQAKVIAIGAFLHMMAICANFAYAIISSRAYICAAHYEQHPLDPGLHSHRPCRTPQVEVALATWVRNLCLLAGILNPLGLLFWSRYLRSLGPKRLAIITNLFVIIFDPLPWLILPLGPPVGPSVSNPLLSPSRVMQVLLGCATLGALTGMGNLHTLVYRTMLVDVAGPAHVTAHLSLFAVAAYASTALGPLVSAAVVHLTRSGASQAPHHTHWLGAQALHSPWTLLSILHPSDELEYPIPTPPGVVPAPLVDPAVAHQRASFCVSLVFGIVSLLWLVLFIDDRPSDAAPPSGQAEPSAPAQGRAGTEENVPDEALSKRDMTASRGAIRRQMTGVRRATLELWKPFEVLRPKTLWNIYTSAESDTQAGPSSHPPSSTEPMLSHAPLLRIIIASVLVAAGAMANSPLMEYLTFRHGFNGSKLAVLLSVQAGVSGLLVFLGVPRLRAFVEGRTAPLSPRCTTDSVTVPARAGDSASSGRNESEDTTSAHWTRQAHIELRAAALVLLLVLPPWTLILAGVYLGSGSGSLAAAVAAVPGGPMASLRKSSRTGATPSDVVVVGLLVIGWVLGSPDGALGCFLQGAGLAVLKSAAAPSSLGSMTSSSPSASSSGTQSTSSPSVRPAPNRGPSSSRSSSSSPSRGPRRAPLQIDKAHHPAHNRHQHLHQRAEDDFLKTYTTLATLVTLSAAVWVSVYAWGVRQGQGSQGPQGPQDPQPSPDPHPGPSPGHQGEQHPGQAQAHKAYVVFVFPVLLGVAALGVLAPLLGGYRRGRGRRRRRAGRGEEA